MTNAKKTRPRRRTHADELILIAKVTLEDALASKDATKMQREASAKALDALEKIDDPDLLFR